MFILYFNWSYLCPLVHKVPLTFKKNVKLKTNGIQPSALQKYTIFLSNGIYFFYIKYIYNTFFISEFMQVMTGIYTVILLTISKFIGTFWNPRMAELNLCIYNFRINYWSSLILSPPARCLIESASYICMYRTWTNLFFYKCKKHK